jgi:hypothetical protein
MSKPNKPNGNQSRRSQNSNKKPGGKERSDATVESASTAASVETVSAPTEIVSAPADTVPVSANTVTAPVKNVSAPVKTVPAPTSTFSSGIQTIAAAYGDYTKKSFEDTKCFVEKLAGVRSLDKALEVQADYAKTAYETLVAESQKIRGLYSDLARQTFKPLESFAAKATRPAR